LVWLCTVYFLLLIDTYFFSSPTSRVLHEPFVASRAIFGCFSWGCVLGFFCLRKSIALALTLTHSLTLFYCFNYPPWLLLVGALWALEEYQDDALSTAGASGGDCRDDVDEFVDVGCGVEVCCIAVLLMGV
jgi:hypothetical protein